MKRAAIYVRVSTQEQKKYGISVDNQIDALTQYCIDNGFEIVNLYNDAGRSGHVSYSKRPALMQMLEDCKAGKIDIILFTKLDRWFRSVPDYYAVQKVLDDHNVKWRAIWEDYETETSSGIFKVNIMLSVAQSEAERTSERTKRTIEYKRSRGEYVGAAPLGYKLVNSQLVKDPATKDAVNAIFRTYLRTFSSREACKAAKEHGKPVERQYVCAILSNPRYTGKTPSGYTFEPYITEEEHQIIMEQKKKHTRTTKDPNRVYLFSGLCVCGYCGMSMPGHSVKRTNKDGSERYYNTYRCSGSFGTLRSCPSLQIQESHIEKYLLDNVEVLLRPLNIEVEEVSDNGEIGAKLKRRAELEAKIKRLANLYADGDIDLVDYRKKRDAVRAEIDSIHIVPTSLPELPEGWREIYEDLDSEHKQRFWRKVIKSIEVTNETKTCPKITFN